MINKKDFMMDIEPLKRNEMEKSCHAFMCAVSGAFEIGYQAGIADTLKNLKQKKE